MKDLLLSAKAEITRLRRENEILGAKVEVMNLFACVLHTQPATYNRGECVDIAWSIQNEIDRLQEEEAEARRGNSEDPPVDQGDRKQSVPTAA